MSWVKVSLLGLLIVVGLAAYAIGASKSSQNVVLCAAKKSGALSLANGKGKCPKGEKKLTIAKQGPTGAAGAAGAVGPQGAPPALEPPHPVGKAIVACKAEPGNFCVTETGFCWNNGNYENGQAPVSFRKDADGYVHLEGAFRNFNGEGACGGNETRPVFYLPPGFRPAAGALRFTQPVIAACISPEFEIGFIKVETDGLVSATIGCLHLDGIVFHADA